VQNLTETKHVLSVYARTFEKRYNEIVVVAAAAAAADNNDADALQQSAGY